MSEKDKVKAWFQGWPVLQEKGGPGSGHWGHAGGTGGPGHPGGSVPRETAMSIATGRDWKERQEEARKAGQAITVTGSSGKKATIKPGDEMTIYTQKGSNVVGKVTETDKEGGKVYLDAKRPGGQPHSASGWYKPRVSSYGNAYAKESDKVASGGEEPKGEGGKAYLPLVNSTVEVTPKHTGWRRTVQFSRWQKHGKDRLYGNYRDYDKHGVLRYHGSLSGYVDLLTGDVTGPVSFRDTVREALKK